MTEARYRDLLTAAPAMARGDFERVLATPQLPSQAYLAVRSALRRIGQERRETCRDAKR